MINLKQPTTSGVGTLKRPSFSRISSMSSKMKVDLKIEFRIDTEEDADHMASVGVIPASMWDEDGDGPRYSLKQKLKDSRFITLSRPESGQNMLEDYAAQLKGTEYKVMDGYCTYSLSLQIAKLTLEDCGSVLDAIDRLVEIEIENDQRDLFGNKIGEESEDEDEEAEAGPAYKAGDLIAGNQGIMPFYGVVVEYDESKGVLFDTLQDGSADIKALDNYASEDEINLWIRTSSDDESMSVDQLISFYIVKAEHRNKIPTAEDLIMTLLGDRNGLEVPFGSEWGIGRSVVSRAASR
jgi:hypothetical protein